MKRKSIALLLSLIMCVALLSACGANDTPDTGEPTAPVSTSTPTGQEPTDENKEQPTQEPEQEEPKEEEPEESAEPTQEEPKEEDNAGTAFLKLLQEEYKTGFVEGERPGCTYCKASNNVFAFISNGVVYIWDWDDLYNAKVFSYDIASKTLSKNEAVSTVEDGYEFRLIFAMNGTVYSNNGRSIKTFDYNGAYQKNLSVAGRLTPLCSDAGFLMLEGQVGDNILSLYSYDLEKLTEIPAPQREVEHGLKEEVDLSNFCGIASDGTVYIRTGSMGVSEPLFRLNTDTYEWENIGADSFTKRFVIEPFCGKYVVADDKIYDGVTGEEVFECSNVGVYPPVSTYGYYGGVLCYFGGDKYLGFKDNEYRWINLTDLSMSAPLPFPEKYEDLYILNDTYCAYKDDYGWFLWNYNTGEEETIYMFEQ